MGNDVGSAAGENGGASNDHQRSVRPAGRTSEGPVWHKEEISGSQPAPDWIAAVAARTAAIRRSVAANARTNPLPPR